MGRKLSLSFAKRRLRQKAALDEQPAPVPVKRPAEGPKQHDGRLIVRNLAFKTKAEDLRKAFESFGELLDCVVPVKDGKTKGFGFVEFGSAAEAKKAMEKVNGTEINGRMVAVDICLPKNSFVQKLQAEEKEEKEEEEEMDGEQDGDSDGEDEKDEEDEEEEEQEADDGKDEEDEDEAEEKPAVDLEKIREAERGRNVFVQNLPFEATRRDVIEAFKECGRVENVRKKEMSFYFAVVVVFVAFFFFFF